MYLQKKVLHFIHKFIGTLYEERVCVQEVEGLAYLYISGYITHLM